MKILLIQPRGTEDTRAEYVSTQFPINLGFIAAVLRNDGHEIRLLDLNVCDIDLKKYLADFSPQAVGITAMTPAVMSAGEAAKTVKASDPEIITILGGVHASALPYETMAEFPAIDILVFGEGEETAVELARAIENKKELSGILGIIFRQNGGLVKTAPRALIKNLDSVPFPARDLIDMSLYKKSHVSRGFSRRYLNIAEIMTSRGCPNRCIFCAGHINYGTSLRFRSFESIAAEIKEVMERYGVNHIDIEDDTFTLNRALVEKLCGFFKENKLTWNCNSRVNTVTRELIKKMADCGCQKISFGVESGSPRILGLIKKGITIPQIQQAFAWAKQSGIKYIEGTFILGCHIEETRDDIEMTKNLIWELMPDFAMLSVMCPFPGTEVYDDMKREGLLPEHPNWADFSFFISREKYKRLKYLTHAELNKIQKDFIKQYFISPKYIWSQIKKIKSWSEAGYFINLGMAYFKKILLEKYVD